MLDENIIKSIIQIQFMLTCLLQKLFSIVHAIQYKKYKTYKMPKLVMSDQIIKAILSIQFIEIVITGYVYKSLVAIGIIRKAEYKVMQKLKMYWKTRFYRVCQQ